MLGHCAKEQERDGSLGTGRPLAGSHTHRDFDGMQHDSSGQPRPAIALK